jgi:hypothetical protein
MLISVARIMLNLWYETIHVIDLAVFCFRGELLYGGVHNNYELSYLHHL